MDPVHRRLCAIMFSDMTGYSRLMGKNEEGTLALVEEMTALMTRLIGEHRGAVLKFIGDAVLATFDSAFDAVFCALAAQQALAERNRGKPPDEQILIRIGIHIGDIVVKEGDVFGDGVNIAARLEPQAKPGGICISQAVYDAVKSRPAIRAVSLGRKRLKNIQEAVPIYHVLTDPGEGMPSAWMAQLEASTRRIPLWTVAAAALLAGAWWGWSRFARTSAPHPTTFTIAVARFSGASAQAKEEGRVMRELVQQRLNELLGRERNVNLLGDGATEAPSTHAEARSLGEKIGADIVFWGEALAFQEEIEIKPHITLVRTASWDNPPTRLRPLRASSDQPDPLGLREAKAREWGDLVLLDASRFYGHKGIYVKALSLSQRISPPSVDALIDQAWMHYDMKQPEAMREALNRAVALDPKSIYPRQMLALSHFLLGDSPRALRELQAVQKEYPSNAKTYQLLGTVCIALGKLDEAAQYAKKALERDPKDSYIYADLGKIYCRQGKYAQAADTYWNWVRIYPYDLRANLLYYLAARRCGRASGADAQLREFLRKSAPASIESDASWPLAVAYFFAGEIGEENLLALIRGRNLSARFRRQVEGNYYLGMAHLLNAQEPDHLRRARDYFEKCVSSGLLYNEYFLAQAELARMKPQAGR